MPELKLKRNARRRRYKAKPGFCGSCQRKYADLNAHNSQIPMPKTALQCALCNKVFLGKKLLDLHVKRHDQPTLPCLKCAKAESSLCQLWSLRFKHFPAQDQMFSWWPISWKSYLPSMSENVCHQTAVWVSRENCPYQCQRLQCVWSEGERLGEAQAKHARRTRKIK